MGTVSLGFCVLDSRTIKLPTHIVWICIERKKGTPQQICLNNLLPTKWFNRGEKNVSLLVSICNMFYFCCFILFFCFDCNNMSALASCETLEDHHDHYHAAIECGVLIFMPHLLFLRCHVLFFSSSFFANGNILSCSLLFPLSLLFCSVCTVFCFICYK